MSVRMFKVGEIGIHKGYVVRVEALERKFAKGLEYMKIKDVSEFNPMLTMFPLYGPNASPVKAPKLKFGSSGSVERADEAIKRLEEEVATRLKMIQAIKDSR